MWMKYLEGLEKQETQHDSRQSTAAGSEIDNLVAALKSVAQVQNVELICLQSWQFYDQPAF